MADSPLLRIAVLLSGRGSNMLAIERACREGRLRATITLVGSDRPEAPGLLRARELGLRTAAVDVASYPQRVAAETALRQAIEDAGADVVALAGYMRILRPEFVAAFRGRMLNIHPSLLPRHKGLHTHRRVLEAGEREHGATVHFVTDELDGGPLVLQARVPVLPGDDEARLAARVQAVEHRIYPQVLGWLAEGRLRWQPQGPELDGRPLTAPRVLETGEASDAA
jgi:phosphoribosylglycinamide formyltransferase-1